MPKDERSSSMNWLSPGDTLRRLQEVGERLTGAARSMAEEYSDSPAGSMTAPMARLSEQAVEMSTLWVAPMRAMFEEQQSLIDAIASWAEEQRKLADRFAELAARHRELNDQVMAALTPSLDHVDRLAGRAPKKSTAGKKKAATER